MAEETWGVEATFVFGRLSLGVFKIICLCERHANLSLTPLNIFSVGNLLTCGNIFPSNT